MGERWGREEHAPLSHFSPHYTRRPIVAFKLAFQLLILLMAECILQSIQDSILEM